MHSFLTDHHDAIAALCRRHGVRKLDAFGSILGSDFDEIESDVDLLVEFDPAQAGSFANFLSLKESLEALFRRRVDLIELPALTNRRLRHHIDRSRAPVYAAA